MPDDAIRPVTISVLLFEQPGGAWCAQCLEYDLAAQAPSLTDLHYELERVIATHIAACDQLGREPFSGLAAAPIEFWQSYQRAELSVSSKRVPFRLPHPASIPSIVPDLRIGELTPV